MKNLILITLLMLITFYGCSQKNASKTESEKTDISKALRLYPKHDSSSNSPELKRLSDQKPFVKLPLL